MEFSKTWKLRNCRKLTPQSEKIQVNIRILYLNENHLMDDGQHIQHNVLQILSWHIFAWTEWKCSYFLLFRYTWLSLGAGLGSWLTWEWSVVCEEAPCDQEPGGDHSEPGQGVWRAWDENNTQVQHSEQSLRSIVLQGNNYHNTIPRSGTSALKLHDVNSLCVTC